MSQDDDESLLKDISLFSRFSLKLKPLVVVQSEVYVDEEEEEGQSSSSPLVEEIQFNNINNEINNENNSSSIMIQHPQDDTTSTTHQQQHDKPKVSHLYFYSQFPSIGMIFLGYTDGSIEMISFQKSPTTSDTEQDITTTPPQQFHQPKRFTSLIDQSKKKRYLHQGAITGILCFSTLSNLHLLVTSCEDGIVKVWYLDSTQVNSNTTCLKLEEMDHLTKHLHSKVVCLKFVFNSSFYSTLSNKEYIRGVFHMVAICENGNVFGWDPTMVNKFHMVVGLDTFREQNILNQYLLESNKSSGSRSGRSGGKEEGNDGGETAAADVRVTSATLSQKITLESKAYIVCGLSNGDIIQAELLFDPPNQNYWKDNYLLGNVSKVEYEYSTTTNTADPNNNSIIAITKVVELSPLSPRGGNFWFLRGNNALFELDASSGEVVQLNTINNHNNDITMMGDGCYSTSQHFHRYGRSIMNRHPLPIISSMTNDGEKSNQFIIIRESCWIFREYLLIVVNDVGDRVLLLEDRGQHSWYQTCCIEHPLFRISPLVVKRELKLLSDIWIVTTNQ